MFHFNVINSNTAEKRSFTSPLFPPDLKTKLVGFVDAANTLNNTAFVKNWNQTRVSIHMANDGHIREVGSLPSDDDIAAFLHRLRPIYLQKEDLNFNTICNLVSAHFSDPSITQCLREWKRHYDARASREVFEIAACGKIVNSQEFLDNYLNALEYHRDQDRKKIIDEISVHFSPEAQKAIIVLLLAMRLKAINKLASFLLTCFSRENEEPLTLEMA